MATHYETNHEYLRDHDWVPDPRHAADDPAAEINAFLNGLVGQESKPSPSADTGPKTKERRRHVSFELDMPDFSPSSLCAQPPNPRRRRTVEPITTTKTFSKGRCSISVPWPVDQATGILDWYAVIPILHHELTHQLLTSCSPWTTWIFTSFPSSPESQTWYRNHIHLPIALSAKLSALNTHNTSLRHILTTFTSSLAETVSAVQTLNEANPQNKDHYNRPLWGLVPLTQAQHKLLTTAEQLILFA